MNETTPSTTTKYLICKSPFDQNASDNEEGVELTEGKMCRGCGAWIVKGKGCSTVQCLFNHHFCFQRGAEIATCSCTPGDNIGREIELGQEATPPAAASYECLNRGSFQQTSRQSSTPRRKSRSEHLPPLHCRVNRNCIVREQGNDTSSQSERTRLPSTQYRPVNRCWDSILRRNYVYEELYNKRVSAVARRKTCEADLRMQLQQMEEQEYGSKTFDNGDRYEGGWERGKKHGHGLYIFAVDNMYEGEWKNDMADGHGIYTYANGNMYYGEYRENKMHGFGHYAFTNGDEYTGGFKDEKKHGHGVYIFANGDKYNGEFRDDTIKNGPRNGSWEYVMHDILPT